MSPTRRRRRPLRLHWPVFLIPPTSPQVEHIMLWPASPPLSLRHRLSRCAAASLSQCAVASLVAPLPLSPRQHLSHCASLAPAVDCYIVTSLAVPVPLLSCRHLSRCAATSFDAGVTHYLTLSYTIIILYTNTLLYTVLFSLSEGNYFLDNVEAH
jgi:hypothetical protein